MPKIIIYVVVAILLIVGILFSQNFLKYTEVLTIEKESFVLLDDTTYVNLKSGVESRESNYLYLENDTKLYSNMGVIYLFAPDKIEMNTNYPVISSDKVSNLFGEVTLISEDFSKSFDNNFIIQDKKLYNYENKIRKDDKNYLFFKLKNGLYINSSLLVVKNQFIPVSSLIIFLEDEIRYYQINDNKLEMKKVELEIDEEIELNGQVYRYSEIYTRIQG